MNAKLETKFINMIETAVQLLATLPVTPNDSRYFFIVRYRGYVNPDNAFGLHLKCNKIGERILQIKCLGNSYPCNIQSYKLIYKKYFKDNETKTYKFFCDNAESFRTSHYGYTSPPVELKKGLKLMNKFFNIELLKNI